MDILSIKTTSSNELQDITDLIRNIIRKKKYQNGIITVFCPHTTAGITINEGTDPYVQSDILGYLQKNIPKDRAFRHAEGNSDAHIKASLIGSSEQIIVEEKNLKLGTWQKIFFAEFDGPRTRKIFMQWAGE